MSKIVFNIYSLRAANGTRTAPHSAEVSVLEHNSSFVLVVKDDIMLFLENAWRDQAYSVELKVKVFNYED